MMPWAVQCEGIQFHLKFSLSQRNTSPIVLIIYLKVTLIKVTDIKEPLIRGAPLGLVKVFSKWRFPFN